VLSEVLRQNDAGAALMALWRYLFATHERVDQASLRRFVVEEMDPKAEEDLMTVYEQLVEQGRKKGRQEGRSEGRAEGRSEGRAEGQAALLLKQLAAKFGPLPAVVAARVKAAAPAKLTAWGVQVLTASTLAEALGPSPRRGARPSRRRG